LVRVSDLAHCNIGFVRSPGFFAESITEEAENTAQHGEHVKPYKVVEDSSFVGVQTIVVGVDSSREHSHERVRK
jgi:hypothetical protein